MLNRHCPKLIVPSTLWTKGSRTELLLGEGPEAITAASGAIPGAGAPPEDTDTIAMVHPGRLTTVSLPPSISVAIGEKMESSRRLDLVGRNCVAFSALQIEIEPLYHRLWSPLPGISLSLAPIKEEVNVIVRLMMDTRD
jgi:hypothetical protein